MEWSEIRQRSVYVPDGPEITVWPAPEHLGPGCMMRMVMPDDGREAQVYLPIDSADHLGELLADPALRRPDPEDAPHAEECAHEWRRAAQTMVWSEIRNRVEGDQVVTESWNRWRVVEVCDVCGNPRVLDEWHHDE